MARFGGALLGRWPRERRRYSRYLTVLAQVKLSQRDTAGLSSASQLRIPSAPGLDGAQALCYCPIHEWLNVHRPQFDHGPARLGYGGLRALSLRRSL